MNCLSQNQHFMFICNDTRGKITVMLTFNVTIKKFPGNFIQILCNSVFFFCYFESIHIYFRTHNR